MKKAEELLARRGGIAVFIGRFVAVVRALIPGIAGMSGLRYRTFLVFNVAGGVAWAAGYTMLGFVVGKSYAKVEKLAGTASLAFVIVLVAVVLGYHFWSRRRERLRQSEARAVPVKGATDAVVSRPDQEVRTDPKAGSVE